MIFSKVKVISKFYQCLYLKRKTLVPVMIAVFQNRDYAEIILPVMYYDKKINGLKAVVISWWRKPKFFCD